MKIQWSKKLKNIMEKGDRSAEMVEVGDKKS